MKSNTGLELSMAMQMPFHVALALMSASTVAERRNMRLNTNKVRIKQVGLELSVPGCQAFQSRN